MRLLDTGLSERGAADARAIMELESTLRELERQLGDPGFTRRAPQYYWFRVLGDPAGDAPWAWRANGHHLAVHLTVVGESIPRRRNSSVRTRRGCHTPARASCRSRRTWPGNCWAVLMRTRARWRYPIPLRRTTF